MKLLRISLAKSLGLNYDLANVSVPPEQFTNGENFSMYNGYASSFNGSTKLAILPSDISPTKITGLVKNDISYYIVMCLGSVWATDGVAWADISSSSYSMFAGDEFLWSYCNIGQVPIVNNPVLYPEYWPSADIGVDLAILPFSTTQTWATRDIKAKVIRSHKNFLFALNIQDGIAELPTTYRWSTAADNGGVPFTWDEADLSAIAGVSVLQGDYGAIIDGLTQRDSFVIYSEFGINILSYVGGEFIWNVQELSNSYGVLSKDCVVNADSIHYFISNGDIMYHNGSSVKSLLHDRLRSRVRAMLASINAKRSFAKVDYSRKEVWFCLVGPNHTLPSFAVIYNYVDDTIATRELDGQWSDISYLPLIQTLPIDPLTWRRAAGKWSDEPSVSWRTADVNSIGQMARPWSAFGDSWTTVKGRWNTTNDIPINHTMIGISPDTGYTSSLTTQDFTVPLETFIMHESFPIEGQAVVTTLVDIYPEIECNGKVSVQLGSQYSLGEPIKWKPAVNYSPSQSKKISARTTGVYHSWKISSIGTDDFRLSAFTFGYEINGAR